MTTQPGRPNVLFLISDDMNCFPGAFGGHPDARTPNIDRLCARGVTFERGYCPSPLCNPSRAAVMSGLMPARTGVYGNRQRMRDCPVTADCVTLTQHFMQHGYLSAAAGKIYHMRYPDPASWDEWDRNSWGAGPDEDDIYKTVDNVWWGPIDSPEEQTGEHKVADYGIAQLQRAHDRPFFLSLGFMKPHVPWYAPRRFFEMYPPDKIALPLVNENDLDDVPPIPAHWARQKTFNTIRNDGKWPEAVAAYLACISYVDYELGRVLDTLDASPYADNTIVVFWGDHGFHLGPKLHWHKTTLWEEACRAPMTIAAPGISAVGGRCPHPVGFIDFYPTLADLAGLPMPQGLDGVSLRPLLTKPNGPWDRPAVTDYKKGNRSVRSRRWRYTRYSDGTEELYNHAADPLEWRNLAGESAHADVKADLGRYIPATFADEAPRADAKDSGE